MGKVAYFEKKLTGRRLPDKLEACGIEFCSVLACRFDKLKALS